TFREAFKPVRQATEDGNVEARMSLREVMKLITEGGSAAQAASRVCGKAFAVRCWREARTAAGVYWALPCSCRLLCPLLLRCCCYSAARPQSKNRTILPSTTTGRQNELLYSGALRLAAAVYRQWHRGRAGREAGGQGGAGELGAGGAAVRRVLHGLPAARPPAPAGAGRTAPSARAASAGAEFQRLKGRAEASLAAAPEEILRSRRRAACLDTCNDPFAVFQWHLRGQNARASLTSTLPESGRRATSESGVTVCLLDDGLDYSNPDLTRRFTTPKAATTSTRRMTMTPCPAPSSALRQVANNFYCGLGVAPGAQVSMLKILDGTVIDSMGGHGVTTTTAPRQLHLLGPAGGRGRTTGNSSTAHVAGQV
uniref:Subtilisin n=1 Tax=Macrostomum lignano TaxID=282301 RepID=A0A1I8FN13_9PLAT